MDSWNKGRRKAPDNRGERHGMSKMTDRGVLKVRKSYANGVRVPSLAKTYGVCLKTIYNILSGQRWKHI